MVKINITIPNLPAIRAAFRLAPTIMRRELQTAIEKTTLTIQKETYINVTKRDIRVVTGGLKGAVQRSASFQPLKGIIDVNIPYASYVHEGTSFMRARPYLQRAVTAMQSKTDGFFIKAVENTLNKIASAT